MEAKDLQYLSKRFGIPEDEIIWYNSGICYSRIVVRTEASAMKVHDAVCNDTVNGGMLDGMSLGGISKVKNGFDVIC